MNDWGRCIGLIVTAMGLAGGGCDETLEAPSNPGTPHCSPGGAALGCADELWLCTGGEEPSDFSSTIACTSNGTVTEESGQDSEVANAYCCTELTSLHADAAPTPVCNPDPTAPCAQAAEGFACTGGDTPTVANASLACVQIPAALSTSNTASSGVPAATPYCCSEPDAGASCAVDSLVACKPGRVGFSCSGAAGPATEDPVLACDEQTVVDGQALYCCAFQAPAGECLQDSAVPCDAGATGYACGGTATPPLAGDAASCLAGTPVDSTTAYCCQ